MISYKTQGKDISFISKYLLRFTLARILDWISVFVGSKVDFQSGPLLGLLFSFHHHQLFGLCWCMGCHWVYLFPFLPGVILRVPPGTNSKTTHRWRTPVVKNGSWCFGQNQHVGFCSTSTTGYVHMEFTIGLSIGVFHGELYSCIILRYSWHVRVKCSMYIRNPIPCCKFLGNEESVNRDSSFIQPYFLRSYYRPRVIARSKMGHIHCHWEFVF